MRARIALLVLAPLSLVLIGVVDDSVYSLAHAYAPGLMWLGRYRVASLIICLLCYLTTNPSRSYALRDPGTRFRLVAGIAVLWFVPDIVMVYVVRVPLPALRSAPDYTAFLVTGLLAEELLFRGAIYQLVEQALPRITIKIGQELPVWPVSLSAVLFALAHLQYHAFMMTPAALAQVGYTLIMGVMWGALRPITASIWPAIAFHLITNMIAMPRILTG